MARLEWVAQRLDNWALWHEKQNAGGLGFSSTAIFTDGPSARGQVMEARLPVDEIEAAKTNDAVESLKLGHGHLYQTLRLFYLRGLGIDGTAATMRRAQSTIYAQLAQADQLLAIWFRERDAAKRKTAEDSKARLHEAATVKRLTRQESDELLVTLAEERRRIEQKRAPFIGPPRPPVKRSRATLKLKPKLNSFTA